MPADWSDDVVEKLARAHYAARRTQGYTAGRFEALTLDHQREYLAAMRAALAVLSKMEESK